MCGRYSLAATNLGEVRARFPIGEAVELRTRYNVAPGDEVLAVTTDREGASRGELLRWGLVPSWAQTPDTGLKMINARVETVAERPAFRSQLERFRCLVIADGFYEWQRMPEGHKRAFHITRTDGELFAFAGLWSIWHGDDDQSLRTCTILTTAANPALAAVHDRMPIILTRSQEAAWLGRDAAPHELLSEVRGLPATDVELHPVGAAVNDAHYDGPECLEPPVPSRQQALF
ncbi:MAG: SOS response-associated peptidase [Actinomycetota bacterium]|nr:SOS response-associated peptidase [Actinomycetota bacterium]